jgi:hypothetical protein
MFDESAYLTREEITQEQTTAEFSEWTERKLDEWATLKHSAAEGRALHEHIIRRRGLFGPFHQEVLPFCRYLQASGQLSSERRCAITLDSTLHYDATLTHGNDHRLFEITQAIEDRQDIRMEELLAHGQVNAIGAMDYSGTHRSGRTVTIDEDVVPHARVLDDLVALVIRRLERKTTGRTANQNYHPSTILLIAIDDYIIDAKDHDSINSEYSSSPAAQQQVFQSVIVIGFAGRLFLQYPRNVPGTRDD